MIVFRYLNREVLKSFLGILMVLMLIFLSQRLVRYLGSAAGGDLSGMAVLQLVALYLPVLFSLLLPLTLFLAILMAFGRLYVENEMTVLRACGVGEQMVVRKLMRLVGGMTIFAAVLTLVVMPWAIEYQYKVLDEQASASELSLLSPGRFQAALDGKSVLYVEEFGEQEALSGVFFATMPEAVATANANIGLLSAKDGYHWRDEKDGQRYLVLEDGFRYEMAPGSNKWTVVKYDRYFMRVEPRDIEEQERKSKALSTLTLLQDLTPANAAELHWRLSVPLQMPVLALLAVPLCRVRPREGKFARVLPGLLIYLGYTLLLMVMRTAVEDGRIPALIGLWPVHIFAAGLGVFLLRKKEIQRAPQVARG